VPPLNPWGPTQLDDFVAVRPAVDTYDLFPAMVKAEFAGWVAPETGTGGFETSHGGRECFLSRRFAEAASQLDGIDFDRLAGLEGGEVAGVVAGFDAQVDFVGHKSIDPPGVLAGVF
jgi:hypothetical protein